MSIPPHADDDNKPPRAERVPTSVYLYYDKYGVLLYVGITSRGIARNVEHNKSKEWFRFVARQEIEHHKSRGAALNRENELIRKFHPPFNKQGNPSHDEARDAYYLFRETPSPARREFLTRAAPARKKSDKSKTLQPSFALLQSSEPLPKTLFLRAGPAMIDGTITFETTRDLPFGHSFNCHIGLRAKDHTRTNIGSVVGVSPTTIRLQIIRETPNLIGLVASVKYPPRTGTVEIVSLRASTDGGLRP